MSEISGLCKAIWTPGWYEMDQSLAVGIKQKFCFFREMPQSEFMGEPIDLVFYNQLDSDCNSLVRFAHVVEIYHDQLGQLTHIDTDGLDYIFVTAEGTDVVVNAEEEPGSTYNSDLDIEDWSVLVTLDHVSDPIDEAV